MTGKEKRTKFFMELVDLLAGCAFPFMLTVILSSSIFIFADSLEDIPTQSVILAVGEALVIASTVIFGKQNGVTAYKRTVSNANKRKVNSTELKVLYKTGEYAPYKGAIIGLIVCVPFIIVNVIYSAFPNDFCRFLLLYVFGWAYYPFAVANVSSWLGLLLVIPFVGVHLAAYVWGGKTEEKKQNAALKAEESTAKFNKK